MLHATQSGVAQARRIVSLLTSTALCGGLDGKLISFAAKFLRIVLRPHRETTRQIPSAVDAPARGQASVRCPSWRGSMRPSRPGPFKVARSAHSAVAQVVKRADKAAGNGAASSTPIYSGLARDRGRCRVTDLNPAASAAGWYGEPGRFDTMPS